MRIKVVALLIVLIIIMCWVISRSGPPTDTRNTTNTRNTFDVKYQVKASKSGRRADLTIRNETGGTEKTDFVFLPWEMNFQTVSKGAFLYISAQATRNSEITCIITVNGIVIQQATSKGEYVIATCSGSTPWW